MVKASYLTGPELEQARNVIRIDDEDTSEFSEESLDDAVGDYRDLAGLSESDADQPSTSTGLRASKRRRLSETGDDASGTRAARGQEQERRRKRRSPRPGRGRTPPAEEQERGQGGEQEARGAEDRPEEREEEPPVEPEVEEREIEPEVEPPVEPEVEEREIEPEEEPPVEPEVEERERVPEERPEEEPQLTEQFIRDVLERGAEAREKYEKQLKILMRERYASPLPDPADPTNVVRYMQELNDKTYTGGLGYYRSEYEQQCFDQRRLAQPIQDFPWLEVRDIPSINGRGIFAKTRILKDQIVCDYRGLFLTVEARDRMLEHMT
ncbi:hypothetical protein COOONC_11804, partial [Cooperia oncophora]